MLELKAREGEEEWLLDLLSQTITLTNCHCLKSISVSFMSPLSVSSSAPVRDGRRRSSGAHVWVVFLFAFVDSFKIQAPSHLQLS